MIASPVLQSPRQERLPLESRAGKQYGTDRKHKCGAAVQKPENTELEKPCRSRGCRHITPGRGQRALGERGKG